MDEHEFRRQMADYYRDGSSTIPADAAAPPPAPVAGELQRESEQFAAALALFRPADPEESALGGKLIYFSGLSLLLASVALDVVMFMHVELSQAIWGFTAGSVLLFLAGVVLLRLLYVHRSPAVVAAIASSTRASSSSSLSLQQELVAPSNSGKEEPPLVDSSSAAAVAVAAAIPVVPAAFITPDNVVVAIRQQPRRGGAHLPPPPPPPALPFWTIGRDVCISAIKLSRVVGLLFIGYTLVLSAVGCTLVFGSKLIPSGDEMKFLVPLLVIRGLLGVVAGVVVAKMFRPTVEFVRSIS